MVDEFQPINPINTVKKTWLTRPRNLLIGGAVVLVLIVVGIFILVNSQSSSKTTNEPTVNIGQKFTITARTSDNRPTNGNFTLTVTDATFADSILVQGQTAQPVKGKIFLVINMEIQNSYKVPLYAFPVDLFRFVRSDGTRFAPSVHQGTVEIRPEATKKSNVAFVVVPTDKKFTIEVGEITGPKKTLHITF